jgi:hypothetical protein
MMPFTGNGILADVPFEAAHLPVDPDFERSENPELH